MAPLVSIVLVNHGQADVTAACLASLGQLTYPAVELIVVDNASPGDDGARLRAAWSPRGVRVLQSRTNAGFTGGNNLGIAHARGAFVLLLNNDTEVAPDFLEPLVAAMQADPRIGVASPKICFFADPARLQYAGGAGVDPWTGRGHMIGSHELDIGQHDVAGPTAICHGAAMLMRRAVIEQVGVLDDDYFIYYEELDYCARVLRAGWTLHYEPASVVWHKESVTTGRESPFKTYYMTRNRILYLRRNGRGMSGAIALAYTALVAAPIGLVRHALLGDARRFSAFWRGLAWHVGCERPSGIPGTATTSADGIAAEPVAA